MKIFTKDSVIFITVAFIIWIILEIVFDLISGMTLNEMLTTRYVVGTLISAIIFAILLLLFELWRNRRK